MCLHCHRQDAQSLCNTKTAGGVSTLTASTSASEHSKAGVASSTSCRQMVSVSVCSCSNPFPRLPHKLSQQTQQQQQQHHLAESASGSSRAAGQQQDRPVNGSKAYLAGTCCSLHAFLVLTLGGKLYSLLLFTTNRQPTACKESAHLSTDTTVCLGAAADGGKLQASSTGCTRLSCGSAGKQTSTLLCWQPQQQRCPAVPSSCSIYTTGCSTQQLLRPTLATGGTGSCAGAPSSSASRHTLPSARKSAEADVILLWLMGMQNSAAAAARATPAPPLCRSGGTWATVVRCTTQMSSAQASFAVPARQPWMACLSLC